MNPKELIDYVRAWGWSKDDLIEASCSLLKEATRDRGKLKESCCICAGDGVIFGEECKGCNN
jgi:hypothetical protein